MFTNERVEILEKNCNLKLKINARKYLYLYYSVLPQQKYQGIYVTQVIMSQNPTNLLNFDICGNFSHSLMSLDNGKNNIKNVSPQFQLHVNFHFLAYPQKVKNLRLSDLGVIYVKSSVWDH